MIQLRDQFGIYLTEDEAKALELMGMSEKDAVDTCDGMRMLGNNAAQMKQLLLRDAYSLQLLDRPGEKSRTEPARDSGGDDTQPNDPARP